MKTINIFFLILPFIIPYLLINFFLIKNFSIFEKKISIIQNQRWGLSSKSHLGGIAFFFNFILVFIFFFNDQNLSNIENINPESKKLLALSFAMIFAFFAGLVDEIEVLPPLTKIIIQFLSASFLIWGRVTIDITNFFWIDTVLTIMLVIFVINIVNIFDNIDMGLAPITILILLFFVLQNGINLKDYSDVFLLYFVCAIIIFLFFNFYPSKLFMGDSGSFQIGILFSFFFIENFFNTNLYYSLSYQNFLMNSLICSLIIPLLIYDFIFVFVARIIAKKNPFHGDTNHIAHKLEGRFKNANIVAFVFCLIQTAGLLLCYYLIEEKIGQINIIVSITFYHILMISSLYIVLTHKFN